MKWTTDQIRDLLDRYWEGETSLAEERLLKEFFQTTPAPEGFEKEALLFQALLAEQAVELPAAKTYTVPQHWIGRSLRAIAAAVALLLTAGAWWWLTTPQPGAAKPLVQTAPAQVPARQLPALAPAATADKPAELAHTTRPPKARKFKSRTSQPRVSTPETIDDPELALAEIRAALALVSSKIKKGKKEMDKGLQEIETLDKMIKKKNEG